jgi:hypothetical protein
VFVSSTNKKAAASNKGSGGSVCRELLSAGKMIAVAAGYTWSSTSEIK